MFHNIGMIFMKTHHENTPQKLQYSYTIMAHKWFRYYSIEYNMITKTVFGDQRLMTEIYFPIFIQRVGVPLGLFEAAEAGRLVMMLLVVLLLVTTDAAPAP